MHELEMAILEIFKLDPNGSYSTSNLVNKIFDIKEPDEKRLKLKQARAHRKLLYHLNKLVSDNILAISGIQGKGEKLFALALQEGELEIQSGKKRIIIHKTSKIVTPIDDYDAVIPYSRREWLHKVNALLIDSTHYKSLGTLADEIVFTLSYVNDVVGVLRFDSLFGKVQDYEDFFERLEKITLDYNKRVALIISLPKGEETHLIKVCKYFTNFKPGNVELIINVTPKDLHAKREFFNSIIPLFIKANIKFHLKNSMIHLPPVIYGNAGPYSVSLLDWRSYNSHERKTGQGLIIAGASIALDLATNTDRLHIIGKRAAEALFLANTARLKHIEQFEPIRQKYTFNYINEHIRFWNYNMNEELFFEEINSVREVVNNFAELQERVYRAAAVPRRFKIVLSSAFKKFGNLSPREYKKIMVKGLHVLQEKPFLEFLKVREDLCKLFEADRARFFRSNGSVEDILHELSFLLNTFALPLITYDFSELQGNLKLTEFFGGAQ